MERRHPFYVDYGITDGGDVYSYRTGVRVMMSPARADRFGHLAVMVRKPGTHRGPSISVLVHRLVLETFSGPCPRGMESRHVNGRAGDNRLTNLLWGTRSENQNDRARHGTSNRGEQQGASRLKVTDIRSIRGRVSAGESQRSVAASFGVDQSHVSRIANRKAWAHED